jgi:hypothetical protein
VGRKGDVGKMNSRPALAFAAAEFRASETGAQLTIKIILAFLQPKTNPSQVGF